LKIAAGFPFQDRLRPVKAAPGPAPYTNFVLLNTRLSVPRLRRSLLEHPYPGLTAGPISCRPFGPDRAFMSGVSRAAAPPVAHVWPQATIATKPRREAPAVNSPERQLGVGVAEK